jgi:RNA recognition motif-containing protein
MNLFGKVYAQEVHIIQGKRVDPKSAHRRDQALARKVFVGGLDTEMTDNELKEYFSQFGKVRSFIDRVRSDMKNNMFTDYSEDCTN